MTNYLMEVSSSSDGVNSAPSRPVSNKLFKRRSFYEHDTELSPKMEQTSVESPLNDNNNLATNNNNIMIDNNNMDLSQGKLLVEAHSGHIER